MGRRALPKIDPNISLDRYFRSTESCTGAATTSAWFGRDLPLELEIGSGKGLFLANAARDCPGHGFVGIEISRKYARFAAFRLARAGVDNALMLHGNGVEFVRDHVRDASVHAVHIYFPDPWWKARHRKRRVMTEAFIRDIERILVPAGTLHFWTDVQEYFDETIELIERCSQLRGPYAVDQQSPEHDLDYRTHFERRMRQHGKPVYRSQFTRGDA